MELQEAITKRHSCRAYLPLKVSDEQIRKIVESARLAPSAKNAQPWKFVCVKTETESKEISKIMADYYLAHRDDPDVSNFATTYATSKILESCPAIILVFEDSPMIDRKNERDISALLSIGAAVEHMMLTATEMGLGCLWIADTFFVHRELAEYVQTHLKGTASENFINDSNRLICAMAVGEMGEPARTTPRKELSEILTIINR